MKYTGTGAQADPYVPTDITGFIYCVAQTGAYVKLVSDIHAGNDPDYSGQISAINCNCQEVSADSLTEIEGVTVYDADFMTHSSSASNRFKNLYFKNCEHAISGSGESYFLNVGSKSYYPKFEDCQFSVRAVYDGAKTYHFNTATTSLVRCAVDFTSEINTLESSAIFCLGKVSYSNFVIRNAVKGGVRFANLEKSAVILENFQTTQYGLDLCTDAVFSYFALVNPKFGTGTCDIRGTSGNLALVALDNPTGNYSVASPFISVTPEQLKDKDYLTSIGFLP